MNVRIAESKATIVFSSALMALAVGCRSNDVQQEHATMGPALRIRVTDEVLHPVSERLFGQFLEKPSWGNETGPEAALLPGTHRLDPRVETMLKAMEIPVVRFPGGTDVDFLDWRDMVTDARGPDSGRPNSYGRHKEPTITNAFGYDEYCRLAERQGWKTILVVNLFDGLVNGTGSGETLKAAADHAAALLAYCAGEAATIPDAFRQWPALRAANGHPDPYAVEYVQIGNETWGWTDVMQEKHGDGWVEAWADGIEAYIAAIRRVAPGMKIISDAHPREVVDELVRRNAAVDLYTFHYYYPWAISALYKPGRDKALSEAAYRDSPGSSEVIGSFEGPTNAAEHYDARYRGYVTAPLTGTYRFWIASDDASNLLLSSSEDPASATRIAGVHGWTNPREWMKEAGQQSDGISLTAGQRYYIEARHREGAGGDNLAVRWELPDGTIEEPIPGHRLEPSVVRNAPSSDSPIPSDPSTGILRETWSNSLAPETVSARQVWETLVHSTPTDESGLAELQDGAIERARRQGYKLAMTEWNLNTSWGIKGHKNLRPGPGGCGLGAAVMLNAMLRAGDVIDTANQSMLVGKSWGITGIRVAKDGVAAPKYMPTFEVTTLYRKHHGDQRLEVHCETEAPMWNSEVSFGNLVTERAAIVDVVATRDAKNLYLHILNTDYDRPHHIDVRLDDLPVTGGPAALHRLRFLTLEEAQPDGPWTLAETEQLQVTPMGFAAPFPCRSATIVVLPLQ